ncbi:MAG: hypothetical protein ACI8U3_002840 [Brevundimonas sp.]|jgi:hypothetical protein
MKPLPKAVGGALASGCGAGAGEAFMAPPYHRSCDQGEASGERLCISK